MPSKVTRNHLEKQFTKIVSNLKISEQLEEVRKFLSHFIQLLECGDPQYEEYYSSTLRLCEALIVRCDVTDRDIGVLSKILNTILEIINRDYVGVRVVIESLATLHNIMSQLYHLEVKELHQMLQAKLPNACKYFNAMENFGIMASIVGILYEYVFKYDRHERESVLLEILDGFYDSTGKLIELLSWPRESFNAQCRKFLNNIPGRKYFSLSARSAVFGGRTIVPRRDYDYISFEWNKNPAELSFSTFSFEGERDKVSEVSVDLQDITAIQIIRDCKEPRVICEYEKITAAGISVDSYQLKIYASDYRELAEVEKIASPFVKRNDPPSPKLPHIEPSCDEVIIRHEKLYESTDFVNHTLTNDNRVTEATKQLGTTPEQPLQTMVHNDKIGKETTEPMAHNENVSEANVDVEEAGTNFKPFDGQWKANLLKSFTKNKRPINDPYDIAHMREEEKEQRKEQAQLRGVVKRANAKKGASVANGKRPEAMRFSEPKITSTPKVVDHRSRLIDMDELSSIDQSSSDERVVSGGSDETYVPYAKLSKTTLRGRQGNQNGRKRQSYASARVPPKRTNAKKNEPKKSGRGTIKVTDKKAEKEQQLGYRSGAPTTPLTTPMDVAVNDGPCHAMDTTLSTSQSFAKRNTRKTNFLCERLNAKKTTTQTTTKVTTTETTEVGIGACTETGHRPKEMATLENASKTTPIDPVPVQAMQKVYTSHYKVEKHQEYQVKREVNGLDCCCVQNTLSEGERAHVLAHVDKIREILSRNSVIFCG